jgi:hypothetical protein
MMKKMLLVLLLGTSVFLNAETNTSMLYDGGENALLVDMKTFYVSINDEVTGGCLAKPAKVKLAMEKALIKKGFKIVDNNKNPFIPEIRISALGFKLNSMCVVDLTSTLSFYLIAEVPYANDVPSGNRTYVRYNYNIGRSIFNYKRHQIQGQLNRVARNQADKIYIKVSRAKDKIFVNFPSMKDKVEKNTK